MNGLKEIEWVECCAWPKLSIRFCASYQLVLLPCSFLSAYETATYELDQPEFISVVWYALSGAARDFKMVYCSKTKIYHERNFTRCAKKTRTKDCCESFLGF